ncbi:MAG: hypothetical protein ACLPTZ_17535, partial [Beijerinckiaceae bacterium]
RMRHSRGFWDLIRARNFGGNLANRFSFIHFSSALASSLAGATDQGYHLVQKALRSERAADGFVAAQGAHQNGYAPNVGLGIKFPPLAARLLH